LLDAASFGGGQGSQRLAAKLGSIGIPNVIIKEGAPLAGALTTLRMASTMRQLA